MTGRAKSTHCKNGHEFTPDNTRINTKGAQICRICHNNWQHEYRGPTEHKWHDLAGNFAKKINKVGDCWIWTGSRKNSYGQFQNDYAHRVSYRNFIGPIPVDTLVLHKCDNYLCVNPDHLFLGTHKDNMQDALAKGRIATGPRHLWVSPSKGPGHDEDIKDNS